MRGPIPTAATVILTAVLALSSMGAAAAGYDAISPTKSVVSEGMIGTAHALGLPVMPWTVNERSDMERLMDMGVNGIITDYPTRLRDVMDDRGLKLPKRYPVSV